MSVVVRDVRVGVCLVTKQYSYSILEHESMNQAWFRLKSGREWMRSSCLLSVKYFMLAVL